MPIWLSHTSWLDCLLLTSVADQPQSSNQQPVAEGTEEGNLEDYPSFISRESHRDVYGAPAPQLISKYERDTPPETIDGKPGQQAAVLPCMGV